MRLLERIHRREFDPAWRLKCDIAVSTAILAGAAISAGAATGSAILGAHAAGKAADTQATAEQKVADMATKAGTDAQTDVSGALTNINNALAPYMQAGSSGLVSLEQALAPGGSLSQAFSFNPTDLQNEPGYQFQLNEGMKALQNSAAAKGSALSTGTQKTLAGYAEGLAGTSFQNAYNRALTTFQTNRNNTLQPLQTLIGVGQNAVNAYGNTNLQGQEYIGNAGLTAAQLTGNALVGKANAQAAGTIGTANAYGNMLSSFGNIAQTALAGLAGTPQGAPTQLPSDPSSYNAPGTGSYAQAPLTAPPIPTYAPSTYGPTSFGGGTYNPSSSLYMPSTYNNPGMQPAPFSYSQQVPLMGAYPSGPGYTMPGMVGPAGGF